MPYRKSRRNLKRRSRRPRRRKRYVRNKRMSYNVIRAIGQPDTVYVKLKFFDSALFTDNPGVSIGRRYRGNSVFDPALSSTNSQPAGFDQWASMYTHYEVLGSSIKCNLVNLSASPARTLLLPHLQSTSPSSADGAEQNYARTYVLSSVNGGGKIIMKNYMRTKKMFGRTTASVNFAAQVTANPAKEWFWQIRLTNLDGSIGIDIDGNIEITYFVKFFERAILPEG